MIKAAQIICQPAMNVQSAIHIARMLVSKRLDAHLDLVVGLRPGLGFRPAPGTGGGHLQACCQSGSGIGGILQAREEAGQQVIAAADSG